MKHHARETILSFLPPFRPSWLLAVVFMLGQLCKHFSMSLPEEIDTLREAHVLTEESPGLSLHKPPDFYETETGPFQQDRMCSYFIELLHRLSLSKDRYFELQKFGLGTRLDI